MITKILKNIICLIIILALSFPSFSYEEMLNDYITKKEFDDALFDFNTRLNAFEQGINTKIDTQVSSYLDRNGIWISKKQVVSETSNTMTLVPPPVTADTNHRCSGDYRFELGTDINNKKIYIDNVTKSGLIFGSYSWVNDGTNDGSSKFGWTGNMQVNTNWRTDNGMTLVINLYERTNGVDTLKYSSVLFSVLARKKVSQTVSSTSSIIDYDLVATLPNKEIINPFQFFVSQGSSIMWDCDLIYHFACFQTGTAYTGGASTIYITMKDADVY